MKSIISKKREFLLHLEQNRGYSDLTIKSYDESLSEAFEHISLDANTLDLMPYRIKLKGLNPKTISKKLSAIRSFIRFLNENGQKIALKNDDSLKVPRTLPKPISHAHILEALEVADLAEKLLITLLYTLGLRISELAELKLEDLQNEWIRIYGKGGKERDVPLLDSTKDLIDQYLLKYTNQSYIFEKDGKRLDHNALRYMLGKTFKKVGLKVTPHQLRHSYATELLNHNAPIADVSNLLGHSSMATTQIYTKLSSSVKKHNYDLAHPLSRVGKDG